MLLQSFIPKLIKTSGTHPNHLPTELECNKNVGNKTFGREYQQQELPTR
jgi:hypothetical protein